jgi:hypothetical protein
LELSLNVPESHQAGLGGKEMTRIIVPYSFALCLWIILQVTVGAQQSLEKDGMDKAKKLLAEIRRIDGHQAYSIDNSQVVVLTPAIKGIVDSGLDSIDVLLLAMKEDSIDFDSFVRCYSACDQILRRKDAKLGVLWYGGCDVQRIQGEQRFFPGGQANEKTFRKSVIADAVKKRSILKSNK